MSDTPNNPDPVVSELANDPDMEELVEMFVNELPGKAAAIQKALADQDLETLGKLAHQLKGSAGGYGFPSITDAANALEASARVDEDLVSLVAQAKELTSLCERARPRGATD